VSRITRRRTCALLPDLLQLSLPKASRARLRHASAGPQPCAGIASRRRDAPRNWGARHGGGYPPGLGPQRGMSGELSAPGASAVARPLSRGGAAESAPPTPGGRPRYRQADGGPPLRALWHRGCPPRAGAAGPSNGASHCLAGQDHRQGRSLRSRRHGDRRKRRPLSSDLPRKEHRHLSGWTEPPVDSVRALGSIETTFHGSSRDLPATAHLVWHLPGNGAEQDRMIVDRMKHGL